MLPRVEILTRAVEAGASDVHIVTGQPPIMRLHTVLSPMEGYPVVTQADAMDMVREIAPERMLPRLEEIRDLDFSSQVEGIGRFRVNAHYQRDVLGIAFRAIPSEVPPFESLQLPKVIGPFADLPRGLVLVTGPTGSGKSTTLASIIDSMNHRLKRHVITVEDPIEYDLLSDQCLIEQRELGLDVPSFASGLRHALRQDPDVILVGEMRDLETTSAAITAAETGHLVLSTMHTSYASQTVARIVDIYPAEQQAQIRNMLAGSLAAVVTQTLFKRIDQPGMIPACEVMICNAAVRNCVRENRLHEIPNIIGTNRAMGMCIMDESIKNLVVNGKISKADALSKAIQPEALARVLGG
ncbi:MAG: PilT/PilU family type 4a pilus ATPase [Phycisphaerae bacterium]|nr:PilT/PilU family type 4a pilus ATPase [Phycisphaerae bacterium]